MAIFLFVQEWRRTSITLQELDTITTTLLKVFFSAEFNRKYSQAKYQGKLRKLITSSAAIDKVARKICFREKMCNAPKSLYICHIGLL